jgi:formamidopyrimidine-DNA glycosylase
MPELPEVETIVNQLKHALVGKKILAVKIKDKKVVSKKVMEAIGKEVVNVWRRAKSIIIEFKDGASLLINLRMTGHFHYAKKSLKLAPYEKYMVAKFTLSDGSLLTHNSIRRFGSVRMLNRGQLDTELGKLGQEPLAKEFTLQKFIELLSKKTKANIKTTLMDQKFLAGIGNIYAMEGLYHARISPKRKIDSLSQLEVKRLYLQLQRILRLAIQERGSTVDNYVHIEGSGGFQKYLAVYGKENCPKKHPMKKVNLGGRGTYYCEKCQR